MGDTRILVADDEPLNLLLYVGMLKSTNYLVVTANDGIEAVEKTYEEKPDLIVLDWNMPRMDGLEALVKIKSDPLFQNTPIIIITGIMTTSENLKIALDAGAVDFLRKPFDKIEFHARVNSALLLSRSINELNEKYEMIDQKNSFINALMNSIPHPMVYYNLKGFIEGFNQRFLDLYELNKTTCKGLNIYNVMLSVGGESHFMIDKNMLQTMGDTSYEAKAGSKNNDFIISKTIYSIKEHISEGIMCVFTDVTDLKNANYEILEGKTKELTSTALRLAHLGEINNSLIADIEKIQCHVDKKASHLIRDLISRFKFNSNEKLWQEFESRFENLYEAFYSKLKQNHPQLSQGERKLCALLKLNLSSKEIASLTFQNPQSVDMARYRLRKKLELGPDDNLVDFLMALE